MYMARMGHCGSRESETSKVGMSSAPGFTPGTVCWRNCVLRRRARHGGEEAGCTSVHFSSFASIEKMGLTCLLMTSDMTLLEGYPRRLQCNEWTNSR